MEENIHGLLAKIAADFDALVREIDGTIERLTSLGEYEPDVQRLHRARSIVATGASVVRDKLGESEL